MANLVKRNVNQYVERTEWLPLALESAAAVIVGIMLLVSPKNASQMVIILLGLFWLIRGLVSVLSLLVNRKDWGRRLGFGILYIVVGALVLAYPLWGAYLGSAVAIWLIAAAGVMIGIVKIIRGFAYNEWGQILLGFLCIALGFLLAVGAPAASLAVPWLVGLGAIIVGGAGIVAAIRKRAEKP